MKTQLITLNSDQWKEPWWHWKHIWSHWKKKCWPQRKTADHTENTKSHQKQLWSHRKQLKSHGKHVLIVKIIQAATAPLGGDRCRKGQGAFYMAQPVWKSSDTACLYGWSLEFSTRMLMLSKKIIELQAFINSRLCYILGVFWLEKIPNDDRWKCTKQHMALFTIKNGNGSGLAIHWENLPPTSRKGLHTVLWREIPDKGQGKGKGQYWSSQERELGAHTVRPRHATSGSLLLLSLFWLGCCQFFFCSVSW